MGKLHKTTGSYIGAWECMTEFNEWCMRMKDGWISITFRRKIRSRCPSAKYTTPFCPTIKRDIKFTDPKDWDVFDKEFAILLERQKKLHPEQHREQKSDTIKNINYMTKHWPKMMAEEPVVSHVNFLLPIARKRS